MRRGQGALGGETARDRQAKAEGWEAKMTGAQQIVAFVFAAILFLMAIRGVTNPYANPWLAFAALLCGMGLTLIALRKK